MHLRRAGWRCALPLNCGVMPVKIEGLENIITMFSVFHDGGFSNCVKQGQSLKFGVDIQYLAERVNPSYRTFSVVRQGVEALSFTTWPDDATAAPDVITDIESIFTPELEILSCELENDSIKVSCNQPLPGLGYCGGER
jgi:hypothetical protein